jgi:acyl-CoA thioesterase I
MMDADRAMDMAGLAVEARRKMRQRSSDRVAPRHGTLSAYVLARAFFNLTVLACAIILGPYAAWSKPAVRILMLGDSITAGYGLPEAESLPAVLQAALKKAGHEVQVMNGGVSGDTTAGGLARVGWMLQEQPQIVIVELGANDGLRGLDPKQSYANLDKLLAALRSAKLKVLLAGMLAPPNLGSEYGEEFAAIFPALAKKHGCLLYPFLLTGVAARPELNQADGIHPNAEGVVVIARLLVPYVEKLLGG